jgi:hypothetical protein
MHTPSRSHEQLVDLLVIGTFGPSVAAILLSNKGVRIPGSKLSSGFACFWLTLFHVLGSPRGACRLAYAPLRAFSKPRGRKPRLAAL